MKRASYRLAVEIIAMNDEPTILIEEEMVGMATVMLTAEIFGVDQERVARDVVRFRHAERRKALHIPTRSP